MHTVDKQTYDYLCSYQSLSHNEQQVLKMLALFITPFSSTTLALCLQKAGLRMNGDKNVTAQSLNPLLTRLCSLELVINGHGGLSCQPLLLHPLMGELEKHKELGRFVKAFQEGTSQHHRSIYYKTFLHCVQDIRIALYLRKEADVDVCLEYCQSFYNSDYHRLHPFAIICPEPLDKEWLLSLPERLFTKILTVLLDHSLTNMMPTTAFGILEYSIIVNKIPLISQCCLYVSQLLLRGRIRDAQRLLGTAHLENYTEFDGWLALLCDDDTTAINCFEQGLKRIRRETGKRKVFYQDTTGLFFLIALVRSGEPIHLKAAIDFIDMLAKERHFPHIAACWMLYYLAQSRLGNNHSKPEFEQACHTEYPLSPLFSFIHSLVSHWAGLVIPSLHLIQLKFVQEGCDSAGFYWIMAEASLLRKTFDPTGTYDTTRAESLFFSEGICRLSQSSVHGHDWERSLKALLAIGSDTPAKETIPKQSRLVWLLSGDNDHLEIQPVEQKQTNKGWTGGRNAGLKRLYEESATLDFLTPHDRKIIACIRKERSYGYYSQSSYEFDTIKAMGAMIDHPFVFNHSCHEEQVTVSKGAFTLEVLRTGDNLTVTLSPLPSSDGTPFYRWEGASRLMLFEPTAEQRRIASIIGEGLIIPETGEKQITAAITAISPHVTIHSDVAGDENGTAETVVTDTRLYILLRPSGDGVTVELRIRPFGEHGPTFPPARGGATLIAQVQGKKVQCRRDQALERQRHETLVQMCSTFDLYECHEEQWRIENPEGTLELLEELHAAMINAPDAYVMQWPEGERFKLRGSASWERLKLSVHSGKDWFSLEGQVPISEEEVITLQRLMELMDTGKGRFIQLEEGQFLALSDEFRRRLADLKRVVDQNGKEPRFHPLAASLVNEAVEGVGGLKGDKVWKTTLARCHEAEKLQPTLPATLQTELRDYQREGFEWLSRLAHWGVGACLADDMGLGKTIQTLALLINRAPAGPSLVLAPTSVCLNWEAEARRFAPTLLPRIFGTGNRKSFIESLQPFDLVICSYTLFQQEAELMNSVRWETAVLDEAQAIKNMATKRSQAAMNINAGFRIATTGTPVENRLDELWNLFRFLNPGLLGSHKSFTERFATPIERDRDKPARTLLKKIIRPFILRRTKSQVLQELPPRTDIVHRVELSSEEASFYEALRRKALDNLNGGAEGQTAGERQIRILAEIMRLRRACCNPRLVLPECTIASAKLTAFREIVDELRENGHRALVFSQFVDHLSILRKELEKSSITYQYLDGSTPSKERQERVKAFQSGQGELFLISLKAGGVGLNLTAADYVIHMDPWWNPAVEDQASDRAHRIGQLRPVTVYRLVATNTIEEKIVALHGQKRDLADSLLEGTDSAARVSVNDLLELLRESAE